MSSSQPSNTPPPPPSSTARTRNNNNNNAPPTISIENVELLEADRQHEKKRSSRQEEAMPVGGPVFRNAPSSSTGGYGTYGSYSDNNNNNSNLGYPPQQQQQQQQPPQDPTQPSNYFYPHYTAPPTQQQQQQQQPGGFGGSTSPHYGMYPPQGGAGFHHQQQQPQIPTGPGAFYPPSGPPGQPPFPYAAGGYPMQQQPQAQPLAQATEYTGIMSSSSGGASSASSPYETGGYGSIPASNHHDVTGSSNRGNGALTIDDIEKTFNSVVSQHYPEPRPATNTEPQRRASDSVVPNKPPANTGKPNNSNNNTASSSTINNATHRRTGSESSQKHRRTPSGNLLPPSGPRASPAQTNRKRPDNPRPRSYSGMSVGSRGELRRSFSREGSVTDLQSVGAQSVASRHSIVSDISKSGLFQGVTDEGHVQLHFPYEAVRLVANPDMEQDRLYMQEIPAAEYEQYHVVAEEANNWEHRMDGYGGNAKKDALPPAFYAIRIEDDLYRRIFDEIADAHQLPCKLFFLGHHVSYPKE